TMKFISLRLLTSLLLIINKLYNSRQADGRLLPQWLTGIIAVVAFLFLTFVVFLVNKAWCQTPRFMSGTSRPPGRPERNVKLHMRKSVKSGCHDCYPFEKYPSFSGIILQSVQLHLNRAKMIKDAPVTASSQLLK
uniref:PDZK1-interacting protein 1 n=1 Tax=Myripristis murdjan TaxID=586833 RepID=A0A667XIS0_9TELE